MVIAKLEDLSMAELVLFAKSVGVNHVDHVLNLNYKVAIILEIVRHLGYFDVYVERNSYNKTEEILPGNVQEKLFGYKSMYKVTSSRKTYEIYYEEEEEFEIKYSGIGSKSIQEFKEKWKESLKLTGRYRSEEKIKKDISSSIENSTNLTLFPEQDLTILARDESGKCTLDPIEFPMFDGLIHSPEYISNYIEKNFSKYPQEVIDSLPDSYLIWEAKARGYKVKSSNIREFFSNMRGHSKNVKLEDLSMIPRINPIKVARNNPNIIVNNNNYTTFLKSKILNDKIIEKLLSLNKYGYRILCNIFDVAELKNERETLELIFFMSQYYTININNLREITYENLRNYLESKDGFAIAYFDVVNELKKQDKVFPRILTTSLSEDLLKERYPDISSACAVFNEAFFTNLSYSKDYGHSYGNDVSLTIANYYGYSKNVNLITPARWISLLSKSRRKMPIEKLMVDVITGKSKRYLDFYSTSTSHSRETDIEFLKNISLYEGVIMNEEKIPLNKINYSEKQTMIRQLSAYTDAELKFEFGEFINRRTFFDNLHEKVMGPDVWEIYPQSSALCNNGEKDSFYLMERTEDVQISYGSPGRLFCYNSWELISFFLEQEAVPGEVSIFTQVEVTKNRLYLGMESYQITNDCLDQLNGRTFYLKPLIKKETKKIILTRESLRYLRDTLEKFNDNCIHILKILVDRLIYDYGIPERRAAFLGDVITSKYNEFSEERKIKFAKYLTSCLIIGLLARFWMDESMNVGNNRKEDFPYDYKKIISDYDDSNEDRRNRRVTDYYYNVVEPLEKSFLDINGLLLIPINNVEILKEGKIPQYKDYNISQIFRKLLSGNFCAKDFGDRMFIFSVYYLSKIFGIERVGEVIRENYTPMEGLPSKIGIFNYKLFVASGHLDPYDH